jgi:hypothetical protein
VTQKVEVRRARAVRRPKPDQRFCGSLHARQDPGPLVLPTPRIVAEPDALESRVRPQIVDMPVGPFRAALMMGDAGPKASRAQSAPQINVEPALESQVAEPPDAYGHRMIQPKYQCVGAGLCSQHDVSDRFKVAGDSRTDSNAAPAAAGFVTVRLFVPSPHTSPEAECMRHPRFCRVYSTVFCGILRDSARQRELSCAGREGCGLPVAGIQLATEVSTRDPP